MSKEMAAGKEEKRIEVRQGGGSSPIYGIGMIGAWVYYFQRAETTEEKVKAFFKGFAWPGFLVYELLKFFNKE